jgi:xanthine/uracil/vitamin C permease (AzgA family)
MSFGIYAAGFAIMICGLVYAAHLAHVPPHWVAAGAIVLVGVGVLSGVKAMRQKDPAE